MVLTADTARQTATAALYQPRHPRQSPLWKCIHDHFPAFRRDYDRRHFARHGPLRPVVVDVVEKYLDCGDLHRGFARGQRAKASAQPVRRGSPDPAAGSTAGLPDTPPAAARSPKIPSRAWRDLIRKVWNTDPLACAKCRAEMRLIALIEAPDTIQDILSHLGLWEERPRGPAPPPPPRLDLQYEPFYDDVPFGPGNTFAS